MILTEFISTKKKNQYQDAIFTQNLGDRKISGLRYLRVMSCMTFKKNLQIPKNKKLCASNKHCFTFYMQSKNHRNVP